jgi:thiol-disulfide isomerase/thioredoxin|tara:strand:+ start:696 stop:1112 length:417 start_codon:yes stop_codon:yes gene_type:complete
MKAIKLILLALTFNLQAQVSVPEKYWIDDKDFESKIAQVSSFGENNFETIVVEFWADFNKENCFAEWNKIKNATYYRVDIAKAPKAKKKYRIRMAPTLLIFKNGVKEKAFKAGLDLMLPTDLLEIQQTINEINTADKF